MHNRPSRPRISIRTLVTTLCTLAALGLASSASGDPHDRWKKREGRKQVKCEEKYNARKGEYKLECKGGGFKYEYKANRDGYKEKYQGTPPPRWAPPPRWVPPPRWAPPAYATYDAGPQVYHGPLDTDIGIHQGTCNRAAVGTLLGGALGGMAGAQFGKGDGRTAATIAGTLLGMYIGGNVGRSLDEGDRYCTGQALEQAPDSLPVVWHNPDTQSEYQVIPTRTFEHQGSYCREYTKQATIDGRTRSVHGTACRQPDGSWQIVQ
jgi:surface antigen